MQSYCCLPSTEVHYVRVHLRLYSNIRASVRPAECTANNEVMDFYRSHTNLTAQGGQNFLRSLWDFFINADFVRRMLKVDKPFATTFQIFSSRLHSGFAVSHNYAYSSRHSLHLVHRLFRSEKLKTHINQK